MPSHIFVPVETAVWSGHHIRSDTYKPVLGLLESFADGPRTIVFTSVHLLLSGKKAR